MNFGKMSITSDWIKISAPNFTGRCITVSDVNKANSVKAKAKARQYKAKARGLQGQGQGLTLQRIKSRS